MRNFYFSLFVTSFLFVANAQAFPIKNADAFVAGDGKAIYETSSGLTWLDFGINNFTTFYDTTNKLGSAQYSGWRLATEAEVLHLFKALLPEFSVPTTPTDHFSEQIQTEDFSPRWRDIYNLWGVNDPQPDLGEHGGHRFFSYSSVGLFLGENGLVYSAGLHEVTFSTDDSNGNYYYGQISQFNFNEADFRASEANAYTSTLLVRDSPVLMVPEPNLLSLFIFGLGGILLSRLSSVKRNRQH